jgi:MraZ protein
MLVKGPDSRLYIYTAEDFLTYVKAHILNRPDEDEDVQTLRTSYFYNSMKCEIDKQGRINFPQEFLDHARVKKEIVFIGTIDRIELWGRECLESKMADGKMEPGRALSKMNKYTEKSDRE